MLISASAVSGDPPKRDDRSCLRAVVRQPQKKSVGAATRSIAAFVLICCCHSFGYSASLNTQLLPKAALVIGIGNYVTAGFLKNPISDAHDICNALRDIGYQPQCFTDIRSRAQFRSIVQDYVESLPPNAVSVIYYAGHAVQINGENFLIPAEAELQTPLSVTEESMSVAYIMNQLRQSDAYLKIVILDACRNNPIRALTQPLAQGLAQIQITDMPDNTVVLYATAANETAFDGEGRNGAFTKNFLAHLRDEGSVDDLFKRVSAGVRSDSAALGHLQIPPIYSNFTGQHCFVSCSEVERLQKQKEESERKIADLQARVASGDESARAELAAAKALNSKLERDAKAAEKATANAKKITSVPPAF
jgi:uncharacterized caspase-like protein